ncbi:hypothetical protein HWA77_25170, partial [Photobacterium damselae subsp. damselae]|nr:hypothetical protein [Photobacterium damselae subsp. damselae]
VCDGQVLNTRTIDAPKLAPIYTVQGGDAKARSAAAFFSTPVPRVEATRYEPQACNHADGEHNH